MIYFKKATESSRDFYFSMKRHYYTSPTFVEARGAVLIDGRSVSIDVEYKDIRGRWMKPPINGRRTINRVFPDDNQD